MYERFKKEDLILRDLLARDRTVLANERTLLSYVRTAFAFAAGGVTLTQLPQHQEWMSVAAVVMIAISAVIFLWGVFRFRIVRKHLKAIADYSAAPPETAAKEAG